MKAKEEFERQRERMRDGDLLGVIRENPALYMGESTLTALYHFLGGFKTAGYVHRIQLPDILPEDFHDWIAYRLHFLESTSGYRRMILQHFPDESVALGRFFALLDEYQTRQAKVVAKVRCHPINPDVFSVDPSDLKERTRLRVAEEINLVVYTDDQGFFVTHDDQAAEHPKSSFFCPALSWLHKPFSPDAEYTKVLDQDQFDRLCRENLIHTQRRKEKAEEAKWRFESKRIN